MAEPRLGLGQVAHSQARLKRGREEVSEPEQVKLGQRKEVASAMDFRINHSL